jgi:bifunctional non-homologous end joining protein LigD
MRCPYPDGTSVPLPPFAPPILAREVTALPRGEDWIYEFLWGGERVRAVKRDGGVRLLTREGREITNRFPRIAAAVARLRSPTAVIDGEILYLDSYAEPPLRFLAEACDDEPRGGLAFLAYDLLWEDNRDLRQWSLLCRRLLLASLVQSSPIILSPLVAGNSDTALAAACRLGFRGIVAKRAGSLYRPNALVSDWVKVTFVPPADVRMPTHHPFGQRGTLDRGTAATATL